jgi:phosphatidylglycerophosphatase A
MGKTTRRLNFSDLANPWRFLALGFGSGLAPYAPGTFGTLMAVPLYLLLLQLTPGFYLLFLLAAFLLGIAICGIAAKQLGVHDHPGIVWDEFVGFWLTMFMAPPGWLWIVVGFILFRLFDILKPWPIRFIDQRVAGGLGIMLDDVLAGIFGLVCLQLIVSWAGIV